MSTQATRLRVLNSADLERALPMPALAEAMKGAFAALCDGRVESPPRTVLSVPRSNGTVLLMGAVLAGEAISSKTVAIFHNNSELDLKTVNGVALLLAPETGMPRALIDGGTLTALRTGAASAAATDLLARPDAKLAAVIGCGVQARTQVLGIDAVRALDEIRIAARRIEAVETFVELLQPRVRCRLVAVESVHAAVQDADIVCLATNSKTPVLKGKWLKAGSHINGVGSFTLDMREADGETVSRARIFIDSLESALAEAGDLVLAEREGVTRRADWIELGRVVRSQLLGRQGPEEITFFKSVGHAVQDAAAGGLALRASERDQIGYIIEL